MAQNHTPTVNLPATAAECALAPRNFRNPEPANNVLGTGSRYNATDPDDIVKELSIANLAKNIKPSQFFGAVAHGKTVNSLTSADLHEDDDRHDHPCLCIG